MRYHHALRSDAYQQRRQGFSCLWCQYKTFEISVAKDGGMDELNGLASGTRVEMTGVLTFHKKDDTIFLNMSATNVSTANVSADDSVKGEIEFRGTVGNKIEEKTDKKGNPYLVFSAFSSEKDGEGAAVSGR